MDASFLLELNFDFFWKGLIIVSLSSFLKYHISLSFLPKTSSSSFILALFKLVGVGINFKPFAKSEISASGKLRLDKLTTLGLTNFPS